jgi:hypothetical protein
MKSRSSTSMIRRGTHQKGKKKFEVTAWEQGASLTRSQGTAARSRAPTPATKRRGAAISLFLGAMRGRRGARFVCVCRGEARPLVLKYPAPQTHRTRSTPRLQKITVPCPVGKKKKKKKSSNRVKAGQKPEATEETTSAAHACHCHQTCIDQKGSHMSP